MKKGSVIGEILKVGIEVNGVSRVDKDDGGGGGESL